MVYAANYSVGINVMLKLIADAARALGPDYDMEIVEAHHRGKKDAPSGTALRLAEALAEAIGPRPGGRRPLRPSRRRRRAQRERDWHPDRPRRRRRRRPHGVLPRQRRSHRDHPPGETRDTFAVGAVRAALWVAGCQPGLYDMRNVLGLGF